MKKGIMGTFFHAFYQSDFFGQLIFIGLFALSIFSWIFIIQKYLAFKHLKRQTKPLGNTIRKYKDSLLQVKLDKPSSHPFWKLYATLKERALEILDKNHNYTASQANYLSRTDIELLESHLHSIIVREHERLTRNLFTLSTTATLAPFLGLLGTVWGILITFGELQAGHSISSSSAILGGLATALTTTVLGLLIAIPALVSYSYLKNLSRHFSLEMQDFSHFLLSTIELQYRKVDIS